MRLPRYVIYNLATYKPLNRRASHNAPYTNICFDKSTYVFTFISFTQRPSVGCVKPGWRFNVLKCMRCSAVRAEMHASLQRYACRNACVLYLVLEPFFPSLATHCERLQHTPLRFQGIFATTWRNFKNYNPLLLSVPLAFRCSENSTTPIFFKSLSGLRMYCIVLGSLSC